MKVVVDTNVLVSGLLKPFRLPGRIVMMISSGELELCYDGRILAEYKEVLKRPKFAFQDKDLDALFYQIKISGQITSSEPLEDSLPDADDEPFLEIAIASNARCLITGNLKHYPKKYRKDVKVLSPADFIKKYHSR